MMHELMILDILRRDTTPERKADLIREFMTWDRDKIINLINETGTYNNHQTSIIINKLWERKNGNEFRRR